jgi:hypothetical protein
MMWCKYGAMLRMELGSSALIFLWEHKSALKCYIFVPPFEKLSDDEIIFEIGIGGYVNVCNNKSRDKG